MKYEWNRGVLNISPETSEENELVRHLVKCTVNIANSSLEDGKFGVAVSFKRKELDE